jgi:hypothetical protein
MMTESAVQADDEVIGCLLSERDYAIRSEELAGGLFTTVEEVEQADGYAYRFAGADSPLESMLEFIAAERRCCPFLSFEIAFEPHGGPLWLRMRGSPRVKAFIAEAFTTRVAVPARMDASQVPASQVPE